MNGDILDVTVDMMGDTYVAQVSYVVHLKCGQRTTMWKPHGVSHAAWVELVEDYQGKLTHDEWIKMINQISVL